MTSTSIALVERAQDLELGEVALAGARAGQDDLVVVLHGEAVDEDEPAGRGVSSEEDPAASTSSSALAKGNAAARALVSNVRRSRSASIPRGSVVSQP